MFCQPSDCSVVEGRASSPREGSHVTRDTRDTALVTKSVIAPQFDYPQFIWIEYPGQFLGNSIGKVKLFQLIRGLISC